MINKEFLLDLVCDVCDVNRQEVFGKCRKKKVVLAREVFAYFARNYVGMKFAEIGGVFGKHHSTVIHWLNVVHDYMEVKDEMVCNVINQVESRLKDCEEISIKLSVICPFNTNIFEIGEFLVQKYGCRVIRE